MGYLKVSVSDFLTLFSARAGGDWFFMVKPAKILLCGAMIALSCSTCFAMFLAEILPRRHPDRGFAREPSLHVGGICVELVSVLVARRGCRQGVLQVDRAQVQHLRHQQHRRNGVD